MRPRGRRPGSFQRFDLRHYVSNGLTGSVPLGQLLLGFSAPVLALAVVKLRCLLEALSLCLGLLGFILGYLSHLLVYRAP